MVPQNISKFDMIKCPLEDKQVIVVKMLSAIVDKSQVKSVVTNLIRNY